MERVERPDTEPWHTISSQHNARVKYPLWEPYFNPHTGFAIALELPINRLRFPRRDLVLKYMLADCMCPLDAMQRCQPNTRMLRHMPLRFLRVGIWQIQRHKNACIRIDSQKRPRSSIRRSAPGRQRSPKSFSTRPAKSGHCLGAACAGSGTIQARRRFRSWSSTVLPDRSHAFSWRVSRSSRRLILGIDQMCHIM
jgi:hypothetical protein